MPKASEKTRGAITGPDRSPASRKEQAKDEEELLLLVCKPPVRDGATAYPDSDSSSEASTTSSDAALADDGPSPPNASAGPATLNESFHGRLTDFLKDSREREEKKRKKFELLDQASQILVADLRKKKDVIIHPGPLTFDQRFKSLLRAFDVEGEKGDDAAGRRKSKTALAVKCVASEHTRYKLGAAIDRRIREVENKVLDKKRQFYQFLCDEVQEREKQWLEARAAEIDEIDDFNALHKTFRGKNASQLKDGQEDDFVKYQLLCDIRDAQKNLAEYKAHGDQLDKEIQQRKRKRIEAPGKLDSPKKKLRVHNSKRKSDDEVADQASASIANFCMDWQRANGIVCEPPKDSDEPAEVDSEDAKEDPTFVHENQLRSLLWPKTLRTESWPADMPSAPTGEGVDVLCKVLSALQDIQRVQHLHSLALHTTIEAVGSARLAIAKDAMQQDQLAAELKAAQRATLLATDPDLKSLPFRRLADINHYFLDEARVAKLGKYLCLYVRYSKRFQADVLAAVLHRDLQAVVYWPGTLLRGYDMS